MLRRSALATAAPTAVVAALGAAALGLAGVATAPPASAFAAGSLVFEREEGADRYATAVAISEQSFTGPSGAVVLASGEGFADALAGAPAAAELGAPLLLTPRDTLPASVRAELVRLQPLEAVVLGGRAAVSDAVVAQVQGLGIAVTRASGTNRYDTAAQTALGLVAPYAEPPAEVLVSSGEGFADGLAGGAYGAATASPLLLTARDALPAETAAALTVLAPRSITVLGGPAAVSAAVEAALDAYTTGPVVRVHGDDRYETAADVARRFPAPARSATPLLAAGTSYPDALAGAALGQPLLLTEALCMPLASASGLRELGAGSVIALGGRRVVSDAAASGAACR